MGLGRRKVNKHQQSNTGARSGFPTPNAHAATAHCTKKPVRKASGRYELHAIIASTANLSASR